MRNALEELSGLETRLVALSDDMDGRCKVPLNLPQPDMLARIQVNRCMRFPILLRGESFAAHERQAKTFLDTYRFDYDFQSSASI